MLICLGGVPHLRSGGYPVPCLGGTPSHVRGVPCPMSGEVPHPMSGRYPVPCPGVPHLRSGGVPIPCPGGTPSHVQGVPYPRSGGVPHPRSRGYPISGLGDPGQTWGTPLQPDLGWGNPQARSGMGYPPYHLDLDGVSSQKC